MTRSAYHRQSVQSLHSRCHEVGDCWIWQGATDGHGRPQARHNGKVCYVRRLVRELVDEKPMPPGIEAASSCGNRLCVSPHCSHRATPKQRARQAAKRGAFNDAAKTRRAMRTKRASSLITDAMVAQVRAAPPPCSAIAAATGISLSYVKAIRRGEARRDFSNPFDVLMPQRTA